MNAIHRFTLMVKDRQVVEIPGEAQLLSVQFKGLELSVWALLETTSPPKPRTFLIVPTGRRVPDGTLRYLGTIQDTVSSLIGQTLVWHVFEELPEGTI